MAHQDEGLSFFPHLAFRFHFFCMDSTAPHPYHLFYQCFITAAFFFTGRGFCIVMYTLPYHGSHFSDSFFRTVAAIRPRPSARLQVGEVCCVGS